jgi:hypothetical protein
MVRQPCRGGELQTVELNPAQHHRVGTRGGRREGAPVRGAFAPSRGQIHRFGGCQCGQLLDREAAKCAGGITVHAQQQLGREAGARRHVPGVEQRQAHEADRGVVDRGIVSDAQGFRVLQSPSPMRFVLKAQVE